MMRLFITLPVAGNFSGGCGGRTIAWCPAGNNWLSSPGYLAGGAGAAPPTTYNYLLLVGWAGPWRLVLASTNKQQRHSNA